MRSDAARIAELMNLEHLIAGYGLWAVGLGAAIEGETVVILGGIMVHRGVLAFLPAILVASLGSFLADQIFFTLGRRFRDHSYVRRVQARPAFQRALGAFERYPILFVFAFRFLYGLRTISPLAIGTTSLPATRFLLINALAALVWATVFISLGYLFGQAIEAMFGRVRAVEHILLPLVAIALICGLAIHLIRSRREARAAG